MVRFLSSVVLILKARGVFVEVLTEICSSQIIASNLVGHPRSGLNLGNNPGEMQGQHQTSKMEYSCGRVHGGVNINDGSGGGDEVRFRYT